MSPQSRVSYWPSRGVYGCRIGGKQRILAGGPDDRPDGPIYQAALARFAHFTARRDVVTDGDNTPCITLFEMYAEWVAVRRRATTVELRRRAFRSFERTLGATTVRDLTHFKAEQWLDTMRRWRIRHPSNRPTRWTDGSVRLAVISINAAFNWAVRNCIIDRNPLKGFELPPARSRGRLILTGRTAAERAANHQRILAAASPAVRPVIICLENTGARPGEIINATAADFDPAIGAIVYAADTHRADGATGFSHKTGSKGKDRVILLTGEALEIVRKLAATTPKGPLFRTGCRRGRRRWPRHRTGWTPNELCRRFRTIRKKVGMPGLIAYSYRHTFATAWLEQGRSVDLLADLMGNSPMTIRHHYSHLLGNIANLRLHLEAFRQATAEASAG